MSPGGLDHAGCRALAIGRDAVAIEVERAALQVRSNLLCDLDRRLGCHYADDGRRPFHRFGEGGTAGDIGKVDRANIKGPGA